MASEGNEKSIIRIPVDTAEFDEFTDKFMRYQEKLNQQPEAWAGTRKGIKNTKGELNEMHQAFSRLVGKTIDQRGGTFDKFAKAAKDRKLTGDDSFIAKFSKQSREVDRSWENITKSITSAEKGMSSLLRFGMGFGGLVGLLAGTGVGLLEATKSAVHDAASQNKSAKSLGLELGKESAFTTFGQSLGLTRDDLENAENAKQDVTKRLPYITAGITEDQFNNEDAAELAWDTAKNKAAMYSQWQKQSPAFAATQAQARGWQDSPDELRLLAKNFDEGHIDDLHSQYEQSWRKMGIDQQTGDQATAAKTQFDAAWAEDVKAFDTAFVKLTPKFVQLETDFADWLTTFDKSGELDADIKLLEGGFDNLVALFKKLHLINDDTEDKNKGLNKYDNAVSKNGWQFGNMLEKQFPGYKAWRNSPDTDGGVGTGTKGDNSGADFQDKALDAILQNESSGVNGQTNKKTGAAGLYGITPENYKAAGIDPMDPKASRDLAGKIFTGFMDQFHGDAAKAFAAYDGDTHIADDEKKYHGDWLRGAKPETLGYLKKIEAQGIDLNLSPEDQKYIAEHTAAVKTAKAKVAAPDQGESIGGFSVVPYDDAPGKEPPANAADTGGMLDSYMARLHDGFAKIGDTLSAGGGARFRVPDQSKSPGNQQAPQQVNVQVVTPPGMSTNTTIGGLPQ
jgi:hypothetical protein